MRILLQRVTKGSVTVDGALIGAIDSGLVALVGFAQSDTGAQLRPAAEKLANLRVFPDEKGRFDKSVLDLGAAILCVPQFTLYADTSKGRRPDFFAALKPEIANELFERFLIELKAVGVQKVEKGQFGAHMLVALENDGPVTIMLEF